MKVKYAFESALIHHGQLTIKQHFDLKTFLEYLEMTYESVRIIRYPEAVNISCIDSEVCWDDVNYFIKTWDP